LDYHLTPEAELHLFLADRAQHVREVLRPALRKGRVVLCDRFTDSTLAYQGGGRGFDWRLLKAMNDNATGGLRPDLTLYFDVPVPIGLRRVGKRARGRDRMEREALLFHSKVLAAYRKIARKEPRRVARIDGRPGPSEVFAKVLVSLARLPGFSHKIGGSGPPWD
jgi:dTMP kinase